MFKFIPFVAAAIFCLAGPAQAAHERVRPEQRLHASANELEHATQRLVERVARRAERGDREARRVLPALRQLDHRAERFRVNLEQRGHDLKYVSRRHDRLEHALATAIDCAREYRMRRLGRQLADLRGLVNRMDHQLEQVRVARHDRRQPRNVARHDRRDRRDVTRRDPRDRRAGWDRRDRWEVASRDWPQHLRWVFDLR